MGILLQLSVPINAKPIPKTKRLSTLNHYHEEQLNTVVLILHSIREVPSFF